MRVPVFALLGLGGCGHASFEPSCQSAEGPSVASHCGLISVDSPQFTVREIWNFLDSSTRLFVDCILPSV